MEIITWKEKAFRKVCILLLRRLSKKFKYSGNKDIAIIDYFAKMVYAVAKRKPKAFLFSVLLMDGPGRSCISAAYPSNKQAALNILKETEKMITYRTLAARDEKLGLFNRK